MAALTKGEGRADDGWLASKLLEGKIFREKGHFSNFIKSFHSVRSSQILPGCIKKTSKRIVLLFGGVHSAQG